MAKVIVIYKNPKDAAAFDKHYMNVHVPLAKKIPGLISYDINHGPVGTPAGPGDAHMIATLSFASAEAMKAGMGSAEGKAAAADVPNFADGGADMYFFDTQNV